jgi:rieske iron-sulfur protein
MRIRRAVMSGRKRAIILFSRKGSRKASGCPVTEWVKGEGLDKDVFKCPCHNSEYDPREGAQVVFGPAPRRLAALPLAVVDGALTVAAPFIGKVGAVQAG